MRRAFVSFRGCCEISASIVTFVVLISPASVLNKCDYDEAAMAFKEHRVILISCSSDEHMKFYFVVIEVSCIAFKLKPSSPPLSIKSVLY